MGASQSALNIQKPSQTGPLTQGDRAPGKPRAAATPAISIAPEAVEVGLIFKECAVGLATRLDQGYGVSSDGGYWTKVVFSANGAGSEAARRGENSLHTPSAESAIHRGAGPRTRRGELK